MLCLSFLTSFLLIYVELKMFSIMYYRDFMKISHIVFQLQSVSYFMIILLVLYPK
jgi:hypothetical protein